MPEFNYPWTKNQIDIQIEAFKKFQKRSGFTLFNTYMDVYASQKIKATVKTVGTLILVVFYSSLVDFYYIAPYIHNILSELKFLVKSKQVSAKLVQKIFMDINTMMFDTISFFNGFNRHVIKDDKKHLTGDVIFNERIFLNLRGVINSTEIMNVTRERSGSRKYNELIKTGLIKPIAKTDVKVREPKKYGDEVKLEKNDGGLIKFLGFKRAAKKNLFLGKDINLNQYSEYHDDYVKSVLKLKSMEGTDSGEKEKKGENSISEVFDFINNVTNTDKDNEVKIKGLSFWVEGDEQKEKDKKNEDAQLTFGFDFVSGGGAKDQDLDMNKAKSQNQMNNNAFDFTVNDTTKKESKDDNDAVKKDDKKEDLDQFFNFDSKGNNNNNNDANNNNPLSDFFDFKTTKNENEQANNNNVNNANVNNNQANQNQTNNAFNTNNFSNNSQMNFNNNDSNKNNNNLNNLLSNFNFPGVNTNTTAMTQFIPSFPGNNSNNNNNNNNNNTTAMTTFGSSFGNNNNNNNTNTTTMTQFGSSFGNNNNNNNNTMNQFGSSFGNNNNNNNDFRTSYQGFNNNNNDNNAQQMSQFRYTLQTNNNMNNNNNNFGFNFNQNNLSLFSSFGNTSQFGFGFGNNNMMQFANEPEIFIDLKEKVAFYYNFTTGNKIINAASQGYLGLSTESDTIKNKDFNICFKTEKFKDSQYIQKEFNPKMQKNDELNYKIHFDSLQKNEPLLNYIINPNILAQNRILEPLIGGGNNILIYKFMYNNNVNKEISKIVLDILYKSALQNGNMIKSDGKITTNANNQIVVEYNNKINEGGIEFPPNMNVFAIVGKITITIHLKEDVASEMDVEIKDNFNRVLKPKKETTISYEFS